MSYPPDQLTSTVPRRTAMTSIAPDAHNRKIVIVVDTHKYVDVAVALNNLGARLGHRHVPANREGYARLKAWACRSVG
jgi:hypothetical protein